MVDELLPPDPSVDGWYWLTRIAGIHEAWRWLPSQRSWYSKNVAGSVILYAGTMARDGYRLASPHPIPGPEELDALHALPDAMVGQQRKDIKEYSISSDVAGHWILCARDCAAMLRTALGAKP